MLELAGEAHRREVRPLEEEHARQADDNGETRERNGTPGRGERAAYRIEA